MGIKNIAKIGIKPYHNYRERRQIEIMNVMSVVFALLLNVSAYFNFKLGEYATAYCLLIVAFIFLSIMYFNKIQFFTFSKILISFVITAVPFIIVITTGSIPEGQFLSTQYISITFCIISIILFDQKIEKHLYWVAIIYYIFLIWFFDKMLISPSNGQTEIDFLIDNQYYHKIIPTLCLIGLITLLTLFKKTIYNYEAENESIKEQLQRKNNELEEEVESRTRDLKNTTDKIIRLAFLTSHDLRGPLTSIMSLTSYLKEIPNDEDAKKMIPSLDEKAQKMDDVIQKMNDALISVSNEEIMINKKL